MWENNGEDCDDLSVTRRGWNEKIVSFTKWKLSEHGFSGVEDKEVVRYDKNMFMILGEFC